MNVAERGGVWRGCMPASEPSLRDLRNGAPAELPETYFAFLRFSNGGEGDLGIEPGWFCPWPAEDVLKANLDYQIADIIPGLFGFGSNGGGELFAFDLRQGPPWRVVMAPLIGIDAETVITLAADFDDFLSWGRCADQCGRCVAIQVRGSPLRASPKPSPTGRSGSTGAVKIRTIKATICRTQCQLRNV